VDNERLRLELMERERALSRVQQSVSTLQHRLALLEPRPHAQLDAVNQVLRKIAREVGRLFIRHRLVPVMFVCLFVCLKQLYVLHIHEILV